MRISTLIWVVAVTQITLVTSSKILGIFPFAGKSHMIAFNTLMVSLAERGHEVTTVTPYPSGHPVASLKEIQNADLFTFFKKANISLALKDMKNQNIKDTLQMLVTFSTVVCEDTLENKQVQDLLNGSETYDVIFFTMFFSDCYLGFAHRFKAPFILISPAGSFPWGDDAVGNPYPYAYVPSLFVGATDHMTFVERLTNAASSEITSLFHDKYLVPLSEEIAKKHFGNDMPPLGDILRNASMVFLNNHVAFNYPRPLLPTVLEVGGMHCKDPKPLPKDLQEFVDASGEEGFIFFSMGSGLKSEDFPVALRNMFLSAFSKLKQRVVWKWEAGELKGKPGNVFIGKWLPQQDLLGHPKIRAFITHGGLLSTQETIYHGVPVVGIPIMADQNLNMQKAVSAGYGIKLDFDNLTEDVLVEALDKVLNDPRYRENVKLRQSIFRDQPEDPLTRAIFWTEYVIRHRGARHLRSASLDLSWYQLYLIDVIAVVVLVILTILGTIVLLLRFLIKKLCGQKKTKKE